ncbi:MAG TPA: hypothetical protein VHX60_08470 [Acidobacteriaceae bacterium]|jgi:hypothetical protein|nr:hypothetical protein [Acidobacteriaceae bacterium]
MVRRAILLSIVFVFLASGLIHAQGQDDLAPMVSPQIDTEPGSFSYYAHSVDEIGAMDASMATEITPVGSLYTGYGELVFLIGPELQFIEPRIRTLEKGYLPVVQTTWSRDGIVYRFTFFTSSLDDGTLVNFVRVVEKNTNAQPTRAVLTAASRYQNDTMNGTGVGEHRFRRPAEGKRPGDYRQPGVAFDPAWVYSFSNHAFLRSGQAFYLFDEQPEEKMLTPKQFYNIQVDNSPRALHLFPTSLVGCVSYNRILAPGEERTLTFRMPVVPLPEGAETKTILAADYGQELAKTIASWKKIVAAGMQIEVPEPKVSDTFRASLVYDLLARNHIGNDYIQTVNQLHYHAFWLRDASDIVHMYDVTGYPDIAKQDLSFFPRFQQDDGLYLSQPGQYDAWGEVMWAYGQHYRMTHDLDFAHSVFPSVERSVAWLEDARSKDPLHLIPGSDVKDNEYAEGHITGYNFLALAGLKNAAILADAVGTPEDAARWRSEYDAYRGDLLQAIDRCAKLNGGYIPPSLDGDCGGQDWGNLLGTYPEHVLSPNDPLITATLKAVRAKYAEGISTYGTGRYVHDYVGIKNTLTEILRGEQQRPVQDLYALLVHTSSTQEGFEFAIRAWGDRDFADNLPPHGWFAAEYRTMLRTMMVREDAGAVHLLSVMSPDWMGAGKTIDVERAPTEFGEVAFRLTQPDDRSAKIALQEHWRQKPPALVLHLPWFADVQAVVVDGARVTPANGAVTIPPNAREVDLRWKKRADTPAWSFAQAVNDYRTEYRRRYELYMHGNAAR